MLVAIAGLALADLGARAVLGDVVPGDFVQEVVAARSVAAHTTLYPDDVNSAVQAWSTETLLVGRPGFRGAQARGWRHRQRDRRNRLVAQAHPPTLLLALTPPILLLGARAAYGH